MKLINYKSLTEGAPRKAERAETEEKLLIEIRSIKNRLEDSKLAAYHAIGTKIKRFYGQYYSKNEIAQIAKTIDLSIATVFKIIKFSEKYDWEDIEAFSVGPFRFSWDEIEL